MFSVSSAAAKKMLLNSLWRIVMQMEASDAIPVVATEGICQALRRRRVATPVPGSRYWFAPGEGPVDNAYFDTWEFSWKAMPFSSAPLATLDRGSAAAICGWAA